MYHDASSKDSLPGLPDCERSRSWDGVTNRGAAEEYKALLEV